MLKGLILRFMVIIGEIAAYLSISATFLNPEKIVLYVFSVCMTLIVFYAVWTDVNYVKMLQEQNSELLRQLEELSHKSIF